EAKEQRRERAPKRRSSAMTAIAAPPRVPQGAAVYLAVIQFVFATMWVIYVLFLPGLVQAAGIPQGWIIWILIFDQVLFIVMDVALGVMADRVMRLYGRLALPILVVTAVSCAAFLLIPFATPLAASGGPAVSIVLFVLIFIWSATSSALRAPPWVLL